MLRRCTLALALVWPAYAASAPPLTGIASVSASGTHACAVTTSGALKCWGLNRFGPLGLGHYEDQAGPVTVPGLENGVASVSARGYNTCVVMTSGAAKCWGWHGSIGDGAEATRNTPTDVVGLGSGVVQIVAGRACALTAAGGVKCWGPNYGGALGDGTTLNRTTPVDVIGFTSGVAALSPDAPCALMTAGGVKCWGFSNHPAIATLGANVTAITEICALMAGGSVSCWGRNESGQVGDGTTIERASPVAVAGLSNVVALGGGSRFSCALTSAGAVKCWGANEEGQLGDGSVTNRTTPVDVPGLSSGVAAISVGSYRSCALMGTGEVRCWGSVHGGIVSIGLPPVVDPVPAMVKTVLESIPQAIDFPSPGYRGLGTFTVAATASSGLTVSVETLPDFTGTVQPSVCTVSGLQVTATSFGICRLVATQAGNGDYLGAPAVRRSFVVWDPARASRPRLVNVSTRARVQADFDLIAGFIIGGAGNKNVVYRTRGPSLVKSGVTNVLARPLPRTYLGQTQVTGELSHDYFQFTSYWLGFGQEDSAEWSVLSSLSQNPYTTVVGTNGGPPGVAIVEVFEIDNPDAPITNVSTRGRVGTGDDVMIGGFVIGGSGPLEVVIRARGPSLAAHGVPNVLANPVLELFSGQTLIGSNDDWGSSPSGPQIQASGFAPADAREAAILVTLQPGAYTAIVSGAGATTGNAIFEVFVR